MRKVVVGIIPTYSLTNESNDPYADRSSFVRMYSKMVIKSGGIPIGILENNIEDYKDICDAYIWPGGSKINMEFNIFLEDAIKNNKPFLGVCLGMQSISTLLNIKEDMKLNNTNSLIETYKKMKESNPYLYKLDEYKIINHSHDVTKEIDSINLAKHKILIEDNTILKSIYNKNELEVVSLHKVAVNRVSKDIIISAKSLDGVIEAIEYKDNILGIQYHPEIVEDNLIFDWLINKAKDNIK